MQIITENSPDHFITQYISCINTQNIFLQKVQNVDDSIASLLETNEIALCYKSMHHIFYMLYDSDFIYYLENYDVYSELESIEQFTSFLLEKNVTIFPQISKEYFIVIITTLVVNSEKISKAKTKLIEYDKKFYDLIMENDYTIALIQMYNLWLKYTFRYPLRRYIEQFISEYLKNDDVGYDMQVDNQIIRVNSIELFFEILKNKNLV